MSSLTIHLFCCSQGGQSCLVLSMIQLQGYKTLGEWNIISASNKYLDQGSKQNLAT